MDFEKRVERQRFYFRSGETRPLSFRIEMLKRLQSALKSYETEICEALWKDMNKCPSETYMTEIGMVLDEIRHHLKHLPKWMKAHHVRTPLAQFPSKSFVSPEPYGVALIMSPWNYPLQLCLEPLVGAISAGCTAIVKPSAYTPHTSAIIAKILGSLYPPEYIDVVEGGRAENAGLLAQHFDTIFFTGSPDVGKLVMESAAKYLTPVTLELGGKSPAIVDESADLELAAKRIAFGKVINAGQTCVAPDYVFVDAKVKAAFIKAYEKALKAFFPDADYTDYNVIVNTKHFERVKGLMASGRIVLGGDMDEERRFIAPTLLDEVSLTSPIMQEEIFGPILPMITYTDISTCIDYIVSQQKPLALYLFTNNSRVEKRVLNACSFGGGCINDTIIHLATPYMGFGGVGASGMGSYHGKLSFDTFTHYRSIVKKANWLDLPFRYRPYTSQRDSLIRLFLK